jgi:hypothetical protein
MISRITIIQSEFGTLARNTNLVLSDFIILEFFNDHQTIKVC